LAAQDTYDIYVTFNDLSQSAGQGLITATWLFNVYTRQVTNTYNNYKFGPSYWLDHSTGNNAEKIPSFLRVIGYGTGNTYPGKMGVMMKKGLPFIAE
jgi:hypothetical protein